MISRVMKTNNAQINVSYFHPFKFNMKQKFNLKNQRPDFQG